MCIVLAVIAVIAVHIVILVIAVHVVSLRPDVPPSGRTVLLSGSQVQRTTLPNHLRLQDDSMTVLHSENSLLR